MTPIALFIETIVSVSVVKAVYIEKRELTCAYVGGGSKVPLGFVSLVENVVMIAMGLARRHSRLACSNNVSLDRWSVTAVKPSLFLTSNHFAQFITVFKLLERRQLSKRSRT